MARTYRNVKGMDSISSVLQGLPKELLTSLLAEAVDAGAKPLVIAAKRYARRSRDTGALEESISHVVREYPGNAVAVAVVGPDTGHYRNRKKIDSKLGTNAEQPAWRAHFIEFGHLTRKPRVRGGVRGKSKPGKMQFVPAQPFMRPAVLTSWPQVAVAMQTGLAKGIERTRARLIKSGAHAA
jgi:HK97 gp10 family phage protein